MVSYTNDSGDTEVRNVLILIVVEDGLVQIGSKGTKNRKRVLILIVVEDGLVLTDDTSVSASEQPVLILIVVEDGLVLDLIRHY